MLVAGFDPLRDEGRAFAAKHAEGVFISPATAEQAREVSDDIRNRASYVVNGATRTAHVVADYAREGADTVAGVVRRHPAAATSAGLITLGIVGGVVGYLLANSTPPARDSRWRWN